MNIIIKKFPNDKGYWFRVLLIMSAFGLCCYISGAARAIITNIFQKSGADFLYNSQSWTGYIMDILSSAIAIVLCAVAGHLWLRDLSKKQIAVSCTVYNIYAVLATIVCYIAYSFILTSDFFSDRSSFLYNIATNFCNLIRIGTVMPDSITEIIADTMDFLWKSDRSSDGYYMYIKIIYAVKFIVQLALPYLLVFFGKSDKDIRLKSTES